MKNPTSHAGKGPYRDADREAFWRKTLKEQADSGQNIRAFCRAGGLTEPSFYAWRRAIAARDGNSASRQVRATRPTFVELRPKSAAPGKLDVPLEIVAGDRRLLIRPGCDRTLLREVLAVLGG
jgi:hypothetical protein